jgi:hypothetical protein
LRRRRAWYVPGVNAETESLVQVLDDQRASVPAILDGLPDAARPAGHLDTARELLGGRTGLGR